MGDGKRWQHFMETKMNSFISVGNCLNYFDFSVANRFYHFDAYDSGCFLLINIQTIGIDLDLTHTVLIPT